MCAGNATSATCRQWILCANVRAHSRSEQRRTGHGLSRSPVCPCCRCGTSGLRRSWWSAPDTERLWSRTRTLNSPGGAWRAVWDERTSKTEREKPTSLYVYSQQIYCWPSPKSASHWAPWTLLSSSWFSSSPVFCTRTSSLWLWPGMHTPGEKSKQHVITKTHQLLALTVLPLRILPSPALDTVWTCL